MPGTSPRGPRWKWRWRGRSSPSPQALFPLYWEEQSPRIYKWVWCKTSRPPQVSYVLDPSSALVTVSKSVIGHQRRHWNLDDLCTNDVKFCLYEKWGNRQWVGAGKKLAPAVCFRETGKWKLSKSFWSDNKQQVDSAKRKDSYADWCFLTLHLPKDHSEGKVII